MLLCGIFCSQSVNSAHFLSPVFHFMHNNISMYPFGQLRLHFECDLRWYSLWSNFSIKVILRIKVNVFKFFTFKIRSKCALFFTDKCYTICQSVPCRPPKLSSSCVHAVDVSHSLAKCFQSLPNQCSVQKSLVSDLLSQWLGVFSWNL